MTLDQAKTFFHSMGCSAFHMSREDPGTYRQYLALGISKEIERTWAIEAVESAISKLLQPDSAPDDLWAVHTQASETIISDRLTELLPRFVEATGSIAQRISQFHRLMVAETIIGRQEVWRKPGLIFFACDSGYRDLGRELSSIASSLVATPFQSSNLQSRRSEVLSSLTQIADVCLY